MPGQIIVQDLLIMDNKMELQNELGRAENEFLIRRLNMSKEGRWLYDRFP